MQNDAVSYSFICSSWRCRKISRHSTYFISPQGAVLSNKHKSTGQSKCAMLVRCVDMRRVCLPWGCQSGSAPGLHASSGASAAVAQFVRSLVKSRRRSRISRTQPRAAISGQRDTCDTEPVILRLYIDIAMMIDERVEMLVPCTLGLGLGLALGSVAL